MIDGPTSTVARTVSPFWCPRAVDFTEPLPGLPVGGHIWALTDALGDQWFLVELRIYTWRSGAPARSVA